MYFAQNGTRRRRFECRQFQLRWDQFFGSLARDQVPEGVAENQARVMCAYGVAGKKPLGIPRQAIIHQLIRLRFNHDDNLRPNRNAGAR